MNARRGALVLFSLFVLLAVSGCATDQYGRVYVDPGVANTLGGAAIGAAGGAAIGAIAGNPAAGAAIGAAAGATAGALNSLPGPAYGYATAPPPPVYYAPPPVYYVPPPPPPYGPYWRRW